MSQNRPPLLELVEIVARLRGPEGCPWDKAQTLQSMRPYLLEEVYELLDAMQTDNAGLRTILTGKPSDVVTNDD